MPTRTSTSGSELFIVDNSNEDWKVLRYLHDWCGISRSIDIATGYFEIGSLLALEGEWQKVDQIRILMGDQVSARTREALLALVAQRLDESVEKEKRKNDFLHGVPAIVDAIRSGKILCKVYTQEKFHAKAYITHARLDVVGSAALVGSSNFTKPGITENIELNVQITGAPVRVLQEWYEEHWKKAEDVTADVLKVLERHTREYSPFEVYAKSLQELFAGTEMSADEWERTGPDKGGSHVYHRLDPYQREGYHALMKIASRYGGAFLCDGVGLGKTYVGLMVIERLVREKNRVALIVPKSARVDVWERDLRRILPHLSGRVFNDLWVLNHTDLLRSGDIQRDLEDIRAKADAIVIDEAHHFRNPGVKGLPGEIKTRYWRLLDLLEGPSGPKKLFLLTATPINNRLTDFQHLIELFSRRVPDYFKAAPLGIHSLPGHFRKLEKHLEGLVARSQSPQADIFQTTNQVEAEQVLWNDSLFRELVVQRSRAYVRKSQEQHGAGKAIFPTREAPRVVEYQLKKTYGRLLDIIQKAFEKEKPLFSLAVYYPLAYYIGPDIEKQKRAFEENRQKEVVTLIRTQFLKRFESSVRAFEFSCESLLLKLLTWITKHSLTEADIRRLDRWKRQNSEVLDFVARDQREMLGGDEEDEADEDIIDEEMLAAVDLLKNTEYKVDEIVDETYLDLDQLTDFLAELRKFKASNDDKLSALVKLLRTDSEAKEQKILIFTEYMATARYLHRELAKAGFKNLDQVDSGTKRSRSDIIRSFAPYYNQPPQQSLLTGIDSETDILISTDVLSEGLNLQDATRMINYDLHWNPVRLMQRIGRVDRRLNPEIEAQIAADHPERESKRGKIVYWNFLPPDEMNDLLRLYTIVSKKTLRISKVFGIEGKKLLTPDDDFDALKDFNHDYEREMTDIERLRTEYRELLRSHPALAARLDRLPLQVFSGMKRASLNSGLVFLCYRLPVLDSASNEWTTTTGDCRWMLLSHGQDKPSEDVATIANVIRCAPETPRQTALAPGALSEAKKIADRHLKNTYMKSVQAPAGIAPQLMAWMELS